MKKVVLILAIVLIFGAIAGAASFSDEIADRLRARNIGKDPKIDVTVIGADGVAVKVYEHIGAGSGELLETLYSGNTDDLTARDGKLSIVTEGTRLVPVSYSRCTVSESSWTELHVTGVESNAELVLRVENNLWPTSTEYIKNVDFEDGAFKTSTYQVRGCEIVNYALSEGVEKALRQYTPADTTFDTFHVLYAKECDEQYRTTSEDGSIVFNGSVFYISMRLRATEDPIYKYFKLEFRGPSNAPARFVWAIGENGKIYTHNNKIIATLANANSSTWTELGVRIDLNTKTMDYYVAGRHVSSCELEYSLNEIMRFSTWGPPGADGVTRAILVDDIRIFQ